MTPQPGQMLAHYRTVERIGRGGMGVVWKAVDTRLGREVALKLLPEGIVSDGERLARIESEARVSQRPDRPGPGRHCLERAVDGGLDQRGWVEHDSNLNAVRSHPRFAGILARLA